MVRDHTHSQTYPILKPLLMVVYGSGCGCAIHSLNEDKNRFCTFACRARMNCNCKVTPVAFPVNGEKTRCSISHQQQKQTLQRVAKNSISHTLFTSSNMQLYRCDSKSTWSLHWQGAISQLIRRRYSYRRSCDCRRQNVRQGKEQVLNQPSAPQDKTVIKIFFLSVTHTSSRIANVFRMYAYISTHQLDCWLLSADHSWKR